MRCVRFCARGVSVLALVVALNAPVYAIPKRADDPAPRNPVVRVLKHLAQIVFGDGLIIPWP
jgi:hypothetical protein